MFWKCYVSNFKSLGCQDGHQRIAYSPSSDMDPFRTVCSLQIFFNVEYVMKIPCSKFPVSRISGFISRALEMNFELWGGWVVALFDYFSVSQSPFVFKFGLD